MGHGKDLTSEERGKIAALSLASWKVSAIARAINRSRCAVYIYRKNVENSNKTRKNSRRTLKLSSRDKRLIRKEASKGLYNVKQIRDRINLNVSSETIQLVLHENNLFVYCKPMQAPWLTELHKNMSQEWAQAHLRCTDNQWKETIFPDDKKFNVDGPDGL